MLNFPFRDGVGADMLLLGKGKPNISISQENKMAGDQSQSKTDYCSSRAPDSVEAETWWKRNTYGSGGTDKSLFKKRTQIFFDYRWQFLKILFSYSCLK